MEDIQDLLEEDPEASAYFAAGELHYGRLEWLAEHIRRCNYQIDPLVAQKILTLIERNDENCYFELKIVRRSGLSPGQKDEQLRLHRNMDMAIEVARRGGFRRGYNSRVCHDVGQDYGLEGSYVAKQVRPLRSAALETIKDEDAADAYQRGELDFLGRPKNP